ncbi:NlpE-like protein [Pseudoxanthomonas sp. 3HH-4]|uniref:copper resistance protein NlpE N-terminal domain-containing protein n=1 Tax=Pseudoxanthomonas sp. 3HH-4 TaxID=1690214 RepID=UPI00115367C4|nr:copper resistance protein NlpE N-terminal domain-containing protein [Pseudoxanthomonas sp. 3HH-4]TQM12777.1 NlpE-like protein [Pseudoxanthomonas sp. 3HH-4]
MPTKGLPAALACVLPMVASAANPTPATFTGWFFGTVPDAACISHDALLDLQADGRYTLQGHCQDDLQAAPLRTGQWSVMWNGTCVQLMPDGHAARPLEFAIHDDDLLVLTIGSCIEPVEDPRGRTLRRATNDRGND